MSYEKTFEIHWADIDANWHMRNTAYGELGTSTRITFLGDHGFPPEEFKNQGFGPVILREETRYLREVKFGQRIAFNVMMSGLSDEGSHFEFHHDVTLPDGTVAAVLRVQGSWLDLSRRKLRRPPQALHDALLAIPRTEDFQTLKKLARDAD